MLYGNATTNSAWKKFLSNCPIQVKHGSVKAGAQQFNGDNLGIYFTWPRTGSNVASVAVVSGTGLGMRAAEANQYFAAGSDFPGYMIFSTDMLLNGAAGVKLTGFYGNDWSLEMAYRQRTSNQYPDYTNVL